MQKITLLLIVLILSSCTIVKKIPPKEYGLELFSDPVNNQKLVQNRKLSITFITCRKRWFSNGGEAYKYLQSEFKKKYGVELFGVSNMEVELTHVMDSSIFMPSEICHRVVGNPVTVKSLNISKEEKWVVTNPAHHVH